MKDILNSSRPARDGASVLDQNNRTLAALTWNFQASAPALHGGAVCAANRRRSSFRAFRALSKGFFEAEAKREDRIEGAAFGVIVALAVWPMVLAAQALLDLIR